MNRTLRAVLSVLPLLLVSGVAFAAGGHVETLAEVGNKIAFHAVNFVLLVLLLFFGTRGFIRDALANRAASVRANIEESQRLREEAQSRFDELKRKLDGLSAQITQMETDAKNASDAEARALEERAERDVKLIQEHAERTIRNETERARLTLRREAATLAIELATEQLKSRVGAAENDQLTQQFITAVESSDPTASSREVPRG